jgi:RHS repeat-associated protein
MHMRLCTPEFAACASRYTGKERDSESGLDYFGARYMASSMGRFMSPDPLLNSSRPDNPQTWNRYTYALNNPLTITDPTGLYNLINNCASDNKQCNSDFQTNAAQLKDGLAALAKAANGMKDGDQKTALLGALNAIGTENDGNNVGVKFGALADNAAGQTNITGYDAGKLSFTVTFDPSKTHGMFDQAINAAHEGQHVEDLSDPRFADNATTLSYFSQEYRAYRASAYAASALGQPSLSYGKNGQYPIWNGSWAAVDRNLTRYIPTLDKPGHTDHQETTPHDPWSNK